MNSACWRKKVKPGKHVIIKLTERKKVLHLKNFLIILLIISGIGIVIFNSNTFSWLPFGKQYTTQAPVSKQIKMIEIDVSGMDTTIIPEKREYVTAELKGKGKVKIKQGKNKIEISVKHKWFDWFSFGKKAELNVYIPEEYSRDMDIELGSGNLTFSGHSKNRPMVLNELSVDMSSGNLTLDNLSVKHFTHEGSSGNVNIESLATETGTFDISSGNIKLRHYTGAAKAELSSGKLDAQLDELKDAVDIEVSSGKVTLDLPADADFTLNGKVSSGQIHCRFPLKNKKTDDQNIIAGSHGSGKHPLDLTVSSGSIDIH